VYHTPTIPIIYEDDDLLVVNKPPSIPCHPCGSFNHNSIIEILKNEQKYKDLNLLHRLDKLTSGVLMMTKSKENCQGIQEKFKNEKIEKMYFARVSGNIKEDNFVIDKPLVCLSKKNCVWGIAKKEDFIKELDDSNI
jgi:23S rRNA-/tRNA-specific pseudouridylate synthase